MARGWVCAIGAVALVSVAAACGGDTFLDLRDPVPTSPTPTVTPTVTPTPTPVVTPIGFGDGHDGALSPVAGDTQPTVCRKVVTASSSGNVTVANGAGLVAGKYLVMQVQDDAATILSTGPLAAADLGRAGLWEIAQLSAPAGNVLTPASPLQRSYDSTGTHRAQVCRFPEYTDVTLTDVSLSATGWDGEEGGVLGFFVSGTLSMNAGSLLRADDAGFEGGELGGDGGNNSILTNDTSSTDGGGKGEGFDKRQYSLFGRANYGIAGGGGNSRDSGGGGGGGPGGAGGRGGGGVFGGDTWGLGGAAIAVSAADRLFLGGGGGAGHQSDTTGGRGADGGGIILVFVNVMTGSGTIRVDGDDAESAGTAMVAADGAGGGGAGGTIALVTSSSSWAGTLDASGGDGGDCELVMGEHGPGGGGGGGRIRAPGTAVIGIVDGGASGTNIGGGVRGSTDGADGVQE